MKTEDFERLKAVCEKEGFEIIQDAFVSIDGTIAFVRKKDPWKDVEFVNNGQRIRKIKSIEKGLVFYEGGSFNHINECKPSTEQAYVDQLKKEAFQRFGEIKAGDRFKRDFVKDKNFQICSIGEGGFDISFRYYKDHDSLTFRGTCIYNAGKWAERVKERVEVEGIHSGGSNQYDSESEWKYYFEFNLKNFDIDYHGAEKMHNKVLPFLAEQLEKYLNNEL